MDLTKHISDVLAWLHLSPDPRDLKFYYEPNQHGTLIFIRSSQYLVTTPEEADSVLRRAFFSLNQKIRVSKTADYAKVVLFLYGISGDINTKPGYLWSTPDGYIGLQTDPMFGLFVDGSRVPMGSPHEVLLTFGPYYREWLRENYEVDWPILCEIKDGVAYFSAMVNLFRMFY